MTLKTQTEDSVNVESFYNFLFRHHHTDGAYFGTGFPHMLFMVHPEYRCDSSKYRWICVPWNTSLYGKLSLSTPLGIIWFILKSHLLTETFLRRPKRPANQFVPRLYGFKIHPLAYQIQQQAAANFKVN